MSRVLFPTVSASEFHALVDSMSSDKPLNTHNLLQVMVDILREEWICNFLFTNEPLHISHFNSPALANVAITCDLRVTRVDVRSMNSYPPTAAIESHKFYARYLFVPCFTVQDTTVGVGVMESLDAVNDPQRGDDIELESRFHNMRFVRDSRRRSILAVLDSPNEEYILVHYSRTDSRSCPYTLAVKFRRRQLLAITRERRYQLNAGALEASFSQYIHSSQLRSCPKCSAPPASGCPCYLNTMRSPLHPFDVNSFKFSVAQDFGSYQGLTNTVTKTANGQVRNVCFGTHSSFQGIFDPSSVQRMSTWALSQQASRTIERPKPSIQFTMSGEIASEIGSGRQEFCVGGDFYAGQTVTGEEIHETLLGQVDDSSLQPVDQILPGIHTEHGGNQGAFAGIPMTQVEHTDGNGEEGIDLGNRQRSFPTTPCSLESGRRPRMTEEQYREDVTELFGQGEGMEICTKNATEENGMEIEKEQCPSSSGTSGLEEVQSSRYGNCSQARSIARELQAARRRLQNRASAHRSNMKKKAFIHDMKQKLKTSKDRVESLREQEMKLRLENLRLRKEVEK